MAFFPSNPKLLQGFQQNIFKVQVSEGCLRVCDQFLLNSLIGWGWSILRHQKVWGLCAHGLQIVNFFILVAIFSIQKTQEYAWDTIIWVNFQRGTPGEDMGEGPHRVLFSYSVMWAPPCPNPKAMWSLLQAYSQKHIIWWDDAYSNGKLPPKVYCLPGVYSAPGTVLLLVSPHYLI